MPNHPPPVATLLAGGGGGGGVNVTGVLYNKLAPLARPAVTQSLLLKMDEAWIRCAIPTMPTLSGRVGLFVLGT